MRISFGASGVVGGWIDGKDENSGALTGVWAVTNTRDAIWDSMRARETLATSGTRMKVRLFAGRGLPATDDARTLVESGYAQGVPMGSTLAHLTRAPTFAVYAVKDPAGANLDHIQIIKGWVDADGAHHEKIVDVVWSGNRKPDASGKLPPVGNTGGLEHATLHERHRRDRTDRQLDRPRLRSRDGCGVLPARAGDSDAALEHLRRGPKRSAVARRRGDSGSRAGVEFADLVHAVKVLSPTADLPRLSKSPHRSTTGGPKLHARTTASRRIHPAIGRTSRRMDTMLDALPIRRRLRCVGRARQRC
jgi:Protein of unknown function (DUF3604)